jgi:hypothetical protein
MKIVREPVVAGIFYPDSKSQLEQEINLLLEITKSEKYYENIFGLVAPHAGFPYSGKTAAFAYNTIIGKNYDKVIVVSPSHREYFPGISIYNGEAYKTPLGEIELNHEIISKLTDEENFIFKGINGHKQEHALEVQLPFLQVVLKDFTLIPIVMGDQRKEYVDKLADKIASVYDEKTIIIASSDLSHFHNRKKSEKLDLLVEENINAMNYEKMLNDLETNKCEACGGGPISVLIKSALIKGYNNAEVLYRTDSGETTGDTSGVVGYLSAIIYS